MDPIQPIPSFKANQNSPIPEPANNYRQQNPTPVTTQNLPVTLDQSSHSPQFNQSRQKLYSIGQAALYLNVSIDTLRRWEKKGLITAIRSQGNLRLFTKQELEAFKREQDNQDFMMTISETAKMLSVSIQTLRRWDKSGKLVAKRDSHDQRVYPKKLIQQIASGTIFLPGVPEDTVAADKAENSLLEVVQEFQQNAPPSSPTTVKASQPKPLDPSNPTKPAESAVHAGQLPSKPPVIEQSLISLPQFTNEDGQAVHTKKLVSLISTRAPAVTEAQIDAEGNFLKPHVSEHGNDSTGVSILPEGQLRVVVKTKTVTQHSIIFVTPLTVIDYPLCVPMSIPGQGFAVVISQPHAEGIKFSWFVVDQLHQ